MLSLHEINVLTYEHLKPIKSAIYMSALCLQEVCLLNLIWPCLGEGSSDILATYHGFIKEAFEIVELFNR